MKKSLFQQLVLLKQEYQEAQKNINSDLAFGRVKALLFCDHAIELCLNSILTLEKESKPKKESFDSLWEAADLIYREKLKNEKGMPLASDIRALHRNRNLVQHFGDIPAAEVVNKYVVLTESFLDQVMKNFFGYTLEEISLSKLITNAKVLNDVKRAENYLKEGDYTNTLVYSIVGFERSLNAFLMKFPSNTPLSPFLAKDIAEAIWDNGQPFGRMNMYKTQQFIENISKAVQV